MTTGIRDGAPAAARSLVRSSFGSRVNGSGATASGAQRLRRGCSLRLDETSTCRSRTRLRHRPVGLSLVHPGRRRFGRRLVPLADHPRLVRRSRVPARTALLLPRRPVLRPRRSGCVRRFVGGARSAVRLRSKLPRRQLLQRDRLPRGRPLYAPQLGALRRVLRAGLRVRRGHLPRRMCHRASGRAHGGAGGLRGRVPQRRRRRCGHRLRQHRAVPGGAGLLPFNEPLRQRRLRGLLPATARGRPDPMPREQPVRQRLPAVLRGHWLRHRGLLRPHLRPPGPGCPHVLAPVCACDGQIYENPCYMRAAGLRAAPAERCQR